MDTSQPLSRTESPPRCPICLDYHSTDTAVLMPCRHEYDVACIAAQLKLLGERSRQCPLCRAKLEAVKYGFTPDGMYKIHIPGKGEQDSDPFLRDDEIIPPGASEWERRRKFETRRLRTLEDIEPQSFTCYYGRAVAVEGDITVAIRRGLTLVYEQEHGVKTRCVSVRFLSLKALRGLPVPIPDGLKLEPEKVAEARGDIRLCLESLGQADLKWSQFSEIQIGGPEFEVKCDDRGLKAVAMRGVVVGRKLGEEDITIQESLTISEDFLTERLSEEEMAQDVVRGIRRDEREKAVRMARWEMQGVVELFGRVEEWGEHWKRMDEGSTGVLERAGEGEWQCQYCDERHRNGDCGLPKPEDLKAEEGEDSGESDESMHTDNDGSEVDE